MTEVLPTHTPHLFETAVRRAAEALRAGEVVALPTETVYGLAANALDARAVERIFQVKGRPAHNPVIVHVDGPQMASDCARQWPVLADRLSRAFWPGPLTMVLPRAQKIPLVVTAGGDTVGIRWPSHPFIPALIRECGFPLAAPSANLSNRVSPTSASHVLSQLRNKVSLIIDGGPSHVGIESTVVDLSVSPPRLLRPGIIGERALAAITGKLESGSAGHGALKSPGMLKRHYSPQARLVVWSWLDDADLQRQLRSLGFANRRCHILAHTHLPHSPALGRLVVMPREPKACARILYSLFHEADAAGAGLIVVERLPQDPRWTAIADRLSRAAAEAA